MSRKKYINRVTEERDALQRKFRLSQENNSGNNYYITNGKDDRVDEGMHCAVSVVDISHEKPKCCSACNKQI